MSSIRGLPVAVVDFETTGVSPSECAPVSVAVVHVGLGTSEPELVYQSLINPGCRIPEAASEIHGIVDEDVVDAPTPEAACAEVANAIGDRVICAYNLSYDQTILHRYAPRISGVSPFGAGHGICAYVMARAIDKFERGKRLADVCARRHVELVAHDAAGDATATALLLPLLLRQLLRGKRNRFGGTDGPWCGVSDVASIEAWCAWQARAAVRQEHEFDEYLRSKGKCMDSMPWTRAYGEYP